MINVHNVGLYPATMLSQETLELRDNLKGVFDFRHLMHGTGSKKHVYELFIKLSIYTYIYLYIPINLTKMADHILKISRPGVFDFRCINWKTPIIVFMKKCPMKRRRYKRSHWIPMFIGTPCIIISSPLFLFNNTLSPKTQNSIQWKFKHYILVKAKATSSIIRNIC